MKYLEYSLTSRLNNFFQAVDVGTYTLHGELECYSCKLAGTDKKLSKSLDDDVVAMIANGTPGSFGSFSTSPVGPLTDPSSRKTLIYLILTLNHMYPDYDFSFLRAHHFTKEVGLTSAKSDIESLLMEASKEWARGEAVGSGETLLGTLYSAMDECVGLQECDVYSYRAQVDEDPFSEEGNLWAFTFFFYNKKQKRILCFSCRAVSKHAFEVASDSEDGDVLMQTDSMAMDDEYPMFDDDMD